MPLYWITEEEGEVFNIIDYGAAYFNLSVADFCAMMSGAGWTIASALDNVYDGICAIWDNAVDTPPGSLAQIAFSWFGFSGQGGGYPPSA